MKIKIKEKFNNLLDVIVYKEQINLLKKKVKELEEERKPLIDLKNKYLSNLRCKNLEIGRLKKKVEELEETIFNLYGKLENKNIYKLDIKNMNITHKGDKENEKR